MSMIFESLEGLTKDILVKLRNYEEYEDEHKFSWPNYVFRDKSFRRAHLDIVDARSTKKLYMLHLCVFPHVNDPAPIFGFDVIAGPKKVTGAFHDFSPVKQDHKLLEWFHERTNEFKPTKPRELPDWAKKIFSGNMVAAGNIRTQEELSYMLEMVLTNLDHYLKNIGEVTPDCFKEQQNFYCQNQKKNPHTPKVMSSLGLNQEEIDTFIHKSLFPEI
jgi:hypothetical protein